LCKNKFGNECVCWFHLKLICYDVRSYERKTLLHTLQSQSSSFRENFLAPRENRNSSAN
jgi:hypothetical protein